MKAIVAIVLVVATAFESASEVPSDGQGKATLNVPDRCSAQAYEVLNLGYAYNPMPGGLDRERRNWRRETDRGGRARVVIEGDGVNFVEFSDGLRFKAPTRHFELRGPFRKTWPWPEQFGAAPYADVWTWESPAVAGLTIDIGLQDHLLQGQGYDNDGTPVLPRQPLTEAQREIYVGAAAKWLAALPQVLLASLPAETWLVFVDDGVLGLDPSGGQRCSIDGCSPGTRAGFAAALPPAYIAGFNAMHYSPIQNNQFFDLESSSTNAYEGEDFHYDRHFDYVLLHELVHLVDYHYGVTRGLYWEDGWVDGPRLTATPVARWWAARQDERRHDTFGQFVSFHAGTNVQENFAETFVGWAIRRSGRLNPLKILFGSCTVADYIDSKMPLELAWWDKRAVEAATSVDGSMFTCDRYYETDASGILPRPVVAPPAGLEQDPAALLCEAETIRE